MTFYKNALEIVDEYKNGPTGEDPNDEERNLKWKGEDLGSTVKIVTTNIIQAPVSL